MGRDHTGTLVTSVTFMGGTESGRQTRALGMSHPITARVLYRISCNENAIVSKTMCENPPYPWSNG